MWTTKGWVAPCGGCDIADQGNEALKPIISE